MKGYTKNACDRLVDLLKLGYHKKDIHTYDELHDVINENEYINAIKMKSSEFFDFLSWQDIYYRSPAAGQFKRTHIFQIEGSRNGKPPTLLQKYDDNDATVINESLPPTQRNKKCRYLQPNERKLAIRKMLDELKVLKEPGLRPIK